MPIACRAISANAHITLHFQSNDANKVARSSRIQCMLGVWIYSYMLMSNVCCLFFSTIASCWSHTRVLHRSQIEDCHQTEPPPPSFDMYTKMLRSPGGQGEKADVRCLNLHWIFFASNRSWAFSWAYLYQRVVAICLVPNKRMGSFLCVCRAIVII